MNNYTKSLAALKAQATHKLKEVGDQWQTPPALFWGINAVFGPFVLDLFTDGDNSKCPKFYTADNNALVQDWAADLSGGKAFGNPPYSRSSYDDEKTPITGMRNIIAKVMAERDKGAKVVLLLKSATSELWWPEQADHVAFVRGRISFDLPSWFVPASEKDTASSAGFAVTICVFDKEWRGQPMQYIERTTLMAQGNAIMSMIEQRASELAQQYASATIEQRPNDAEQGEQVICLSESLEAETQADLTAESEGQGASEPVSNPYKLPENNEPSGNSGELPEPELSSDGLQLADHIPDAGEMIEPDGTLTDEGTKSPELITFEFEFTSEQLEAMIESGKLPFSSNHLVLMFQLKLMFGDQPTYTSKQVKAAIIAYDDPDVVTKAEPEPAEQPTPAVVKPPAKSSNKSHFNSWDDAVAAIEAKQKEEQSKPEGEAHPFFSGFYAGNPTYTQTVTDKVAKVKTFTLEQCEAALKLPELQTTVVAAVEARIRKLQKEQAA